VARGPRAAGVLQISAILLGGVVVWAMYANLVMRFSWMPRFRDLLMPFAVGIADFLVIEWMTPDRLALWFAGMAGVFAVAMGTNFETFRGAILRDEEGMAKTPLEEQLASYLPGVTTFVALLGFVLISHFITPDSWFNLATLIAANAGLAAQLVVLRNFWRDDLAETG